MMIPQKQIEIGNGLIRRFMGYPFFRENCYVFQGGPITGERIYVGDICAKTDMVKNFEGDLIPMFYLSEDDGRNMCRGHEWVTAKEYHTSWDYLSEVIKKIVSLKYPLDIYFSHVQNTCRIYDLKTEHYLVRESDTLHEPIEIVWLAIVEFIKSEFPS